jgi:site-specific DNA-methyltransferase (adenine-specific)/modification methylase
MSKRYDMILGDAREHIKTMPNRSVDLILTDPPYNLREHSTGNIAMRGRADFNNDIAEWDEGFDPASWLAEFQRILTPSGNLFAFTSYHMMGKWTDAYDPAFSTFQWMCWHKTNPAPKIYKAGFLNSCEPIIACWNKGHTWNFGKQNQMHNFLESPICMGNERLGHPTQKPVSILKKIIAMASRPGDVVYDPFAGVASVGEAALSLDRSYIGVEREPAWHAKAERRLQHIDIQSSLFSVP